jgi:translation initiation factor IF-2
MPPRFAYWTIILEGKPTAFRAQLRDELVPTFKQLQAKHPDVVMKWFARGRLWESQDEERAAQRASREKRPSDWRPGGEHRDPRARFEIPRDEKRRRFAARFRRDERDGTLPRTDPAGTPAPPPRQRTGPDRQRETRPGGTRPGENRPGESRPMNRPDWKGRDRPSNRPMDRPTDRPGGRPSDRPGLRPHDRPSHRPGDRPPDRTRGDKPGGGSPRPGRPFQPSPERPSGGGAPRQPPSNRRPQGKPVRFGGKGPADRRGGPQQLKRPGGRKPGGGGGKGKGGGSSGRGGGSRGGGRSR